MMTQPTSRFRARSRFPLWALLALPVVCAPLFLLLTMSKRVSPGTLEDRWIDHPGSEFSIEDGDRSGRGDDLLYVTSVSGPHPPVGYYHRVICSLKPGDVLRCRVHFGNDSWVDTKPAPPGLLARLPGVLQKLPPSAPPADPRNRVVVAFPVNGRWVVRSYPFPGPKEVADLGNTLHPRDDPPAKSTE